MFKGSCCIKCLSAGTVPVTMQPPERVEESMPRSSPVISKKSPSSDLPRSSPVVTRRSPTTVDSQAKILGITEPLPQPNIVVVTSEETEKQVCACVLCMYVRM